MVSNILGDLKLKQHEKLGSLCHHQVLWRAFKHHSGFHQKWFKGTLEASKGLLKVRRLCTAYLALRTSPGGATAGVQQSEAHLQGCPLAVRWPGSPLTCMGGHLWAQVCRTGCWLLWPGCMLRCVIFATDRRRLVLSKPKFQRCKSPLGSGQKPLNHFLLKLLPQPCYFSYPFPQDPFLSFPNYSLITSFFPF